MIAVQLTIWVKQDWRQYEVIKATPLKSLRMQGPPSWVLLGQKQSKKRGHHNMQMLVYQLQIRVVKKQYIGDLFWFVLRSCIGRLDVETLGNTQVSSII